MANDTVWKLNDSQRNVGECLQKSFGCGLVSRFLGILPVQANELEALTLECPAHDELDQYQQTNGDTQQVNQSCGWRGGKVGRLILRAPTLLLPLTLLLRMRLRDKQ